MRITGKGIWGPPEHHDTAIATLRHAVELGANFIDTADSNGPYVSEEPIAEALAHIRLISLLRPKVGGSVPGPGNGRTTPVQVTFAKHLRGVLNVFA